MDTTAGPEANGAAAAPAHETPRLLNRHLSWLEFNARVLAQAEDTSQRPLERAKFLAIFSTNLDEFFEVRVADLHARRDSGLRTLSADGLSPAEQLSRIRARVLELYAEQRRAFDAVTTLLAEAGVRFSTYTDLDDEDRGHLDRVFEEEVFPVLTPLAVDPAHPFPYISSLSLNLAVVVGDPDGSATRIARVKVPPLLPRFLVLPDGERYVPLEQVIAAHLDRLFPGMRIVSHHPFRVTRNADFALDDDVEENVLSAVEAVLQKRRHSPQVMRLEVDATMADEVLELLTPELEIGPDEVYRIDGPLDLGGLWGLHRLDRPELKDEPYEPVTQPRLRADGDGAPVDIFRVIREGDVLFHLPYESFATSIEAFIEQAAADPDVLAIKQTLYRTSGGDSPIVRALIAAAEAGRQVVALVELKARFDEAANIAWARVLERAGVHVVYGIVGLKTHAKTALVVRREGGTIRRYCHIGTGNYNPQTARLYEDLGLLTCDPEIGADVSDLFNYLTGYSHQQDFQRLLVAPRTLRPGLLELIGDQAQPHGRIVIKTNHCVDPEMIEALYAASSAGARIDLVVRSTCAVRPGVPGVSEHIRVRSLVGRWLEHSRIYGFGTGARARWYIGSADIMGRNLDDRVEAVAPVLDATVRARLKTIVEVLLADDRLAWELDRDGEWHRPRGARGISAHELLAELARGAEKHVIECTGTRQTRVERPLNLTRATKTP
ncbi:MAG TPA: polyphosphate kinase 1 [Candidatus Dormibacteraeota bacterium]